MKLPNIFQRKKIEPKEEVLPKEEAKVVLHRFYGGRIRKKCLYSD